MESIDAMHQGTLVSRLLPANMLSPAEFVHAVAGSVVERSAGGRSAFAEALTSLLDQTRKVSKGCNSVPAAAAVPKSHFVGFGAYLGIVRTSRAQTYSDGIKRLREIS